jgi:hypothetical protein
MVTLCNEEWKNGGKMHRLYETSATSGLLAAGDMLLH